MKVISGEPIIDKYAILTQKKEIEYSLDFIYSDNLKELETGIRDTREGIDTANLAIALAIAKIDQDALYAQAGYKSYLQYLETAEDRLNMSRQTISDYKRIGETYLQYRSELQQAGFQWRGNLSKLRYLKKALQNHRASEVFKRITNNSFRKFVEYAEGSSERPDETPVQQYIPDIQITPKRIMIDGINILRFGKDLDERIRDELITYLKRIYEVRATGNRPYIMNVYDETEVQAVERFIKRRRQRR